jgi:hypothetical protein
MLGNKPKTIHPEILQHLETEGIVSRSGSLELTWLILNKPGCKFPNRWTGS